MGKIMDVGVYKIESLVDGRVYVGGSKVIKKRWERHRLDLKKNKHHSRALQACFNELGMGNLVFSVIESCSESDLLSREQFYLDSLNSAFNNCKFAGIAKGSRRSEEQKAKMSERFSGEKNPTYQMERTPEWRDNISKALMGKPSRTNGMTGIYSEETLEKMRAAARGRTHSAETREKLKMNFKGQKHSESAIVSMSKIAKKTWASGRNAYLRPVAKCTKSGDIIEIYESITDAAVSINRSACRVCSIIDKPNCFSAGFMFKSVGEKNKAFRVSNK